MIFIFWIGTFCLFLFALLFAYVKLQTLASRALLFIGLLLFTYAIYFKLGFSNQLAFYYSPDEKSLRIKQTEFRKLLVEFRKEEFRLRIRLDENPKDTDADWRLHDLLAIKALCNNNPKDAKKYWEIAYQKIPEKSENTPIKKRIKQQIDSLTNQ